MEGDTQDNMDNQLTPKSRKKGNKARSGSNFVVQGSILAVAGILVRIIGLAYRVPLTRTIGEEGNGYYAAAYNVYAIMLLLSSYSLPLAVSKMVSARMATGETEGVHRILRAALIYATIVGGLGCAIVWFGADFFANTFFGMPLSKYALLPLAPTIWIMAYLGVFRGYFQGHKTMIPTSVSQILEQIINAVVSVGAAIWLSELAAKSLEDDSTRRAYGAAGGTIGTGAGALFALVILLIWFFVSYKSYARVGSGEKKKKESYKQITRLLIYNVVPVIASTAVYNINSIIDTSIFGNLMQYLGSAKVDNAKQYGIYTGYYLLLINVPVAISNALSSSLIPTLSQATAARERGKVRETIATSIRFSMLVALPCAVGLAVLSEPIITMLFGRNETATMLLRIGSIAVVLYSLSTITNAVLQGTNHMSLPVKNSVISLIIHCIALVAMIMFFHLGIYSLVFANVVFALCMCILNARQMRRYLRYRQEIVKTYIGPALASITMGVVTYLVYTGFSRFIRRGSLAVLVAILAAMLSYAIAVVKFHVINEVELRAMPKGRGLVRIFKKMHLM